MTTPTANYGWIKPDIGASTDAWGGLINSDLDGIDATVKAVSNVANAALPSATASSTYVAKAGDAMTGTLSIAPSAASAVLGLSKPTGSFSNAINAQTAGSMRWQMMYGNGTAEGGSNAGSDFAINAYTDTGTALGTPLTVERKTGYTAFNANGATAIPAAGAAPGHAAVRFNKSGSGLGSFLQGYSNSVLRWQVALGDTTAESANAGSNFVVSAYNDAGAAATVPSPLTIFRSTGVANFAVAIVNGPSDRTLKENIVPLEGALDKVRALQGVSFNMIATPEKREIGLIAQDVEPIVPEIIQDFQTHDSEGKAAETKLALDYPKLTSLLIEAVKTLAARVEALEAARG